MIVIINGPNLNLLGSREPQIYGSVTLEQIKSMCQQSANECGESIEFHQSNHEGSLIEWIHGSAGSRGIVINAGAFTHTSVALRDAIASISTPAIEVHLSNVFARESFRHHSYLSDVCRGTIVGLGIYGYIAAIRALCQEDQP